MTEQLQRAGCCCADGEDKAAAVADISTAPNLLDIDWRSAAAPGPSSVEARNR
ncbi:hypothetical protein [Mycolicibacterium frederiksbergense]|uniref:hypothetical protein n=1 Tax=Mycolicibacterium frederiksbergense TaxID=117567 RepID=UPI00399B28C9